MRITRLPLTYEQFCKKRYGYIPEEKCEHDFQFIYSDFEKIEGPGKNNYRQIDVFYCKKCLEYKRIVAKEENARGKPEWFKGY